MDYRCHYCGEQGHSDHKIGRQDTCSHCGEYLHCCLNCRFYDEQAYHQCRETQAEWVHDKKSANFCDYFETLTGPSPDKNKSDDARDKLNQLFK